MNDTHSYLPETWEEIAVNADVLPTMYTVDSNSEE